jgi:hypothetical protein
MAAPQIRIVNLPCVPILEREARTTMTDPRGEAHDEAMKELRRDLMRFEALPPQSPEAVWEWAQKANAHIHDLLRSASGGMNRCPRCDLVFGFGDAPQPATQRSEPVAWRCRGRASAQHEWEGWRVVGHKPQGPASERFQIEPLYAALLSETAPSGTAKVPSFVQIGWVVLRNDGRIETEINGNVGLTNERAVTMYVYEDSGVALAVAPIQSDNSHEGG